MPGLVFAFRNVKLETKILNSRMSNLLMRMCPHLSTTILDMLAMAEIMMMMNMNRVENENEGTETEKSNDKPKEDPQAVTPGLDMKGYFDTEPTRRMTTIDFY